MSESEQFGNQEQGVAANDETKFYWLTNKQTSSIKLKRQFRTKMHSSRMGTGRSLTVCPGGGGSALGLGGVCFWGCLLLGGCVSAPGAVCSRGCLFQLVASQHALRQTPPLDWITDTSKNITLATTSLRPVINENDSFKWLLHLILWPNVINNFTRQNA